jgi:UDPglucose 6-dehydrogenase
VNERQRDRIFRRLCDSLAPANGDAPTVAVLGLSFKPNTDDLRESPAVDIIRRLLASGVRVRAHDPVAMRGAGALLPEVEYCAEPHEAVANADAVFLATEWDEYRQLDWPRIRELVRGPVVVDGRNALDGARLRQLGFRYLSVGRPLAEPHGQAFPAELIAGGGGGAGG